MESSRTSLASRTDFEVLGLGLEASSPRKLARTALFFGKLKFCGAVEKFFGKRFFVEIAWKIFVKTFFFFFFFFGDRLKNFCEDLFFFFLESTCALCPWSLALASSIPVLGLESVCPRKGCPWLGLGLGFFLCPWPWPWPRALCPRLHLCYLCFSVNFAMVLINHRCCKAPLFTIIMNK